MSLGHARNAHRQWLGMPGTPAAHVAIDWTSGHELRDHRRGPNTFRGSGQRRRGVSTTTTAGHRQHAVVFIHGIGGSARVWTAQRASFAAAGLHAIAVDLPGYGTRAPVAETSFEGMAADLEAQVAALGLDRPVLVGHSMGGMVAQTALRRRPDGYRAAVLCCTSPAFGDSGGDFQRKFVTARLGPLDAGATMAELAGPLVDAMMGPSPHPGARPHAVDVMASVPPATYRAAVRCLVTFDERAALPQIRVPVLCLAGANDRTAPAAVMERMAGKIPGARYACLEGAGHLANLEVPDAFDQAVLGFLRDVMPAS
jgi:3-oxoadipate enol-lactonase